MDVAAEAIDYLAQAMGVPWYHDVPKHAPGTFGTLTRDGGPRGFVADHPTLTLMCHAPTRGACADLAEATAQALISWRDHRPAVIACEVLGDYYDPLDGRCRHRVTAQLTIND